MHSGCNVKSLPALVRKELANCSAVVMFHRPLSFLPLKMAAWYADFRPPSVSHLVTRGNDVNCIRSIEGSWLLHMQTHLSPSRSEYLVY